MNKAKIIFAIIWVFLLGLIIWWVSILNQQTEKTNTPKTSTTGDFSIWIVGDKKEKFTEIINDFKATNKQYGSAQIWVESFDSYADYYTTLMASFIAGKSPDVFVINSNEESPFLEQIEWIDPEVINPSDFRKKYVPFMGDDLIKTIDIETTEGKKPVEFLVGVPLGYETLWVFYNRRKWFQAKDVESWAAINSASAEAKKNDEDFIPVWLGHGSTVPYAADIFSQFLMLDDINSLQKAEGSKLNQALASYMILGDEEGDNGYNKKVPQLNLEWKNVLDLFSREEVGMVFGYPRMIEQINTKGFKKTFLWVWPFPNYFLSSGKTLVNYNYFVVNRNSRNITLAKAFVGYLASENAQKKYLKAYPYYLPSLISLETDILPEKIHPDYNVILKDFVRSDNIKSSFNKWVAWVYDAQVTSVLDDSENYNKLFLKVQKKILCITMKTVRLQSLSQSCE